MPASREMTYAEAVNDALDVCLAKYPNTMMMGLGVPDRSGVFGTTKGLQERHGKDRVFDIPCSEGAVTGACIGMAIAGLRPILCHQRMDFTLLSFEQLVNQAAKWHWLFRQPVPMVIRMVVGRGWGQGPTHAQSFHAFLASIPGLKVIAPATPYDAKGMLLQAIEDPNPVIMVEHRWLHPLKGEVPEGHYTVPFGKARVVKEGMDATVVCVSYGVVDAVKSGGDFDIVDLRSLSPLDIDTVIKSVKKTGRIAVSEITRDRMFADHIISQVLHEVRGVRIFWGSYGNCPSPSSKPLAAAYYGSEQDTPDTAFGPF